LRGGRGHKRSGTREIGDDRYIQKGRGKGKKLTRGCGGERANLKDVSNL